MILKGAAPWMLLCLFDVPIQNGPQTARLIGLVLDLF